MNVRLWGEKHLLTLMAKRRKSSPELVVPTIKVSAASEVAKEAFGQGITNFPKNMGATSKFWVTRSKFHTDSLRVLCPTVQNLVATGDLSPGICAFLLFGKCVHQVVKTFGLILGWKISLIRMSK